jgi:hypothetical protein
MAYQYYCPCCPQPRVLEGAETAVGQPVQCPYCHQVFQQPPPQMAAGPAMQAPTQMPAQGYAPAGAMPGPAAGMAPGYGPQGYAPAGGPGMGHAAGYPEAGAYGPAPGYGADGPMGPAVTPEVGMDFSSRQDAPPENVHIPCPNQQCPYHAQAMEVPSNMMGQDVMCPLCHTAYTLRYEESVEYITRKEEFLRRKEERFAKSALNWAIAAAIVVVLGLLVMMFVMSGGPVQK